MPSVILTVSQNTFVSSAQPNNNFCFYPVLYTGTDAGFGSCTSLLKFDLSTVEIDVVDSAELVLSVIVKTGARPSKVVVNRVVDYFNSTKVTYAAQPAIEAIPSEVRVTAEDLYTTLHIDVTQLVNDWLSRKYKNRGIALTNTDRITVVQFGSDRIVWEPYFPKLVLNYFPKPIILECPLSCICSESQDVETGEETITCVCTAECPGEEEDIESETKFPFDIEELVSEITQISGGEYVTVSAPGTYAVWFKVSSQLSDQFTLYCNGEPVPAETGLSAVSGDIGIAVISADTGDKLTVKPSPASSETPVNDERASDISSSVFVVKIG